MLLTPHAAAGLVIAKYEPNAALAIMAVVMVHFILDAIPHKDMIGGDHINSGNIIMRSVDVLLMLAMVYWLTPPGQLGYSAVIVVAAILPDIIELPGLVWPAWRQLPLIKPFHHWHTAVLQYAWPDTGWVLGLAPQVLLLAICYWALQLI